MYNEQEQVLHSDEVEYSILSNLMTFGYLMAQWQESLDEDLFHNPQNKVIYQTIKTIYDNGDVPDMLTVSMHLMENPVSYAPDAGKIATIASYTASDATFEKNLEILQDMAKRRRYWELGHRLIAAGIDLSVDIGSIDGEIDKVREENMTADKDVYDMRQVNQALTERIAINTRDEKSTMIPTGYSYIDSRGGFQLADFNVIGGSTSQGKTTLAINILTNAAKRGIKGMFISLEMTIEQLAARINSPLSGVSSGLMLYKKLYTDQIRRVESVKIVTDELPILVDDSSPSYEKMKDKIRAKAVKDGVKLFIIDYLQILSGDRGHQSEAQFLERISRELKILAKKLKICIVALSQMNRQANEIDPRPTLSKLKASSGIEQAADTILMLYRPGSYGKKHKYRPDLDANTVAEIIIGKGRNIGGVGSFYVGFKGELSLFYDLEPTNEEPNRAPEATEQGLPF